jgi:SAM-dependent methyltransferase
MSFYRHHALYHAFFAPSGEIRGSVDAMVGKHLGKRPRRVLDPACGPSTWLEHWADRGAGVTGIELDADVAAAGYARLAARRAGGREAQVLAGDMRSPPEGVRGPFELIINLDNSIGHLGGLDDVERHLAAMRSLVADGGLYLLGLAVRERGDSIEPATVYERGPQPIDGGGFAAVRSETLGLQKPERKGDLACERIRHLVITASVPGLAPLFLEQYDLLTFPFLTLKDLFARTGWTVADCRDATDEELPRARFAAGCGDVLLGLTPVRTAGRSRSPRAATRSSPRRRTRG